MRGIFKAILAGAVALGLASPVLAQDKVIKMGTMSWEDLTPITGITKKVLEDKGYTVEVTPFSEWGIAYAALAKGDVQILASQTDYVAQDYWQRNKNRLEKISPVSHGLYQGIAVPKYVPIDSIEQLNENADKFGGKIVGIADGHQPAEAGATLVVNDYWELAIEEGCDFVHLGQEDLDEADVSAIRAAGIRLGISTHDVVELDRALALAPDYVALGPVYPTILKQMKWHSQGVEKLTRWKARIGDLPLCAIGGLTPERARLAFAAGADVAAAVTDITLNPDPDARVREWLDIA